MPIISGGNAPYAPPTTVTEIVRRYRERGLATPFTKAVLERAGVSETLSQRTLQALKLLNLADSEGNPTAEFEAAVRAPDADFRERMKEIIIGAYGEVFSFADPAEDSYERVRDAFRDYNPRGQQERMVTLYLGLLDFVGIDTSAASSSRRASATPNGSNAKEKDQRREPRAASGQKGGRGRSTGKEGAAKPRDARDAALVAWFDSRPAPSEPWTKVERDAFMVTLRAIIDGIYAESAPEAAESEDTG